MDKMEMNMLRMSEMQPKTPFWAKAERFEMSASDLELWNGGKQIAEKRTKTGSPKTSVFAELKQLFALETGKALGHHAVETSR